MSGTGYAAQLATEATGAATPAGEAAQLAAEAVGSANAPGQAAQLLIEVLGTSWYQTTLLAFTNVQSPPERPFPIGFRDYPPPPLVQRFGQTGPLA